MQFIHVIWTWLVLNIELKKLHQQPLKSQLIWSMVVSMKYVPCCFSFPPSCGQFGTYVFCISDPGLVLKIKLFEKKILLIKNKNLICCLLGIFILGGVSQNIYFLGVKIKICRLTVPKYWNNETMKIMKYLFQKMILIFTMWWISKTMWWI